MDIKIQNSKFKVQSSENSEVELIDYKTGAAQLSRAEILNKGASLQLFPLCGIDEIPRIQSKPQAYTLSKTPKSHGCPGKRQHDNG